MCYGMGCGLERRDTGTCANPRHCTHNHAKEADMNTTEFYCPECEAKGQRVYLNAEGHGYRCRGCKQLYSREDLHNAYRADLANLEADADFVRNKVAKLGGARAVRNAA